MMFFSLLLLLPLAQANDRIVGGTVVTKEIPFFAALTGKSLCGGAFISKKTILTAAHCLTEDFITYNPNITDVTFANLDFDVATGKEVQKGVAKQVWVKTYNKNMENDIGAVCLDSEVTEVAGIIEKGVPDFGAVADNANLHAMGHGLTSNGGSISKKLLEINIFKQPDATCAAHGLNLWKPKVMFCAGVADFKKDTCGGDSGGPVVRDGTNKIVGLVSFGIKSAGCANNKHGFYTRMSNYEKETAALIAYCDQGTVSPLLTVGVKTAPATKASSTKSGSAPIKAAAILLLLARLL